MASWQWDCPDEMVSQPSPNEIASLKKVADRALKLVRKTRSSAYSRGVRAARQLPKLLGTHPWLRKEGEGQVKGAAVRANFLSSLRNFRPASTILEVGATANRSERASAMVNISPSLPNGLILFYMFCHVL